MVSLRSIVASPNYDFSIYGLERLHPFDGRKFSKAVIAACRSISDLDKWLVAPHGPATYETLRLVHPDSYITLTMESEYVLEALEIPRLPVVTQALAPLLRKHVIEPMLWAVNGTVLAAELALQNGIALNVGGGFHHAGPTSGGGFCLYADVPIAIEHVRRAGLVGYSSPILLIDLDAHQGNGFERAVGSDESVYILDVFNPDIYPGDKFAADRIDYPVRLHSETSDAVYLSSVADALDEVLDRCAPALAFYIAGTDIVSGDRLGRLAVSPEGIATRDSKVLSSLAEANVPSVVVTGGGYTRGSSKLVAQLITQTAQQLARQEKPYHG